MRLYTLAVSTVAGLCIILLLLIPGKRHLSADSVVASCDDFVKVTDGVFTGREGAYFTVRGVRAFLGGGTFGPKALQIDGVDPAIYLEKKCK